MKKLDRIVFEKALKRFGVMSQLYQALEEMAELEIEIHKIRRNRIRDIRDLAGEVADVEIMLDQIKVNYGNEFENLVQEIRESKIIRLEGRILSAGA